MRILASLLLSGCTFAPGTAFTEVRPGTILASIDVDTLETADGTVVALEQATLAFEGASLMVLEGADDVTFDPANPPEGYTLCHGDHCHSTSGELVSYDEIIADLAGEDAGYVPLTTLGGADDLDLLAAAPVALGVADVPDLPLARISRVELATPTLRLTGTAGDATPVTIDLTFDTALGGELLYEVERTGDPVVRLDVAATLPAGLLADVDLLDALDGGAVVVDDPASDVAGAIRDRLAATLVDGDLTPVE